ncbi:hypothetical protein N184_35255 [Sinorhizobium sp. GL28]|nr:hypothetical protein N184_35255 [Sinorhizobium sp. GL28]
MICVKVRSRSSRIVNSDAELLRVDEMRKQMAEKL